MPLTISNTTGDGITVDYIDCDIELPDSGSIILFGGPLQPSGGVKVSITGSPLTSPTPPGSGFIYWIIQVHTLTGLATIKQSTSSMPTPDASNDTIFQQTMGAGSTNEALVATNVTPDTY